MYMVDNWSLSTCIAVAKEESTSTGMLSDLTKWYKTSNKSWDDAQLARAIAVHESTAGDDLDWFSDKFPVCVAGNPSTNFNTRLKILKRFENKTEGVQGRDSINAMSELDNLEVDVADLIIKISASCVNYDWGALNLAENEASTTYIFAKLLSADYKDNPNQYEKSKVEKVARVIYKNSKCSPDMKDDIARAMMEDNFKVALKAVGVKYSS